MRHFKALCPEHGTCVTLKLCAQNIRIALSIGLSSVGLCLMMGKDSHPKICLIFCCNHRKTDNVQITYASKLEVSLSESYRIIYDKISKLTAFWTLITSWRFGAVLLLRLTSLCLTVTDTTLTPVFHDQSLLTCGAANGQYEKINLCFGWQRNHAYLTVNWVLRLSGQYYWSPRRGF
jgi:hypothetical protein